MIVRRARTQDLDGVVALWQHHAGPSRSVSGLDEARRLVARDPDALIVAVDEAGVVVGSLIVGWDGWRCHLYRLAVEATVRRAGVASALVAEASTRARALGARRLDAMVHRDNEGAIAFWEALGFELQDDDGRWSLAT